MEFLEKTPRDVLVMGRANVDMYVAVGLARLGRRVDFLGLVSDDSFGRYVESFLKSNGIGTRFLGRDDSGSLTSLAFAERQKVDSRVLFLPESRVGPHGGRGRYPGARFSRHCGPGGYRDRTLRVALPGGDSLRHGVRALSGLPDRRRAVGHHLDGNAPDEAMRRGAGAAALVVSSNGCAESSPTIDEL